jgi:hypothetical protein
VLGCCQRLKLEAIFHGCVFLVVTYYTIANVFMISYHVSASGGILFIVVVHASDW